MAYAKHTWQTGETITATKLNNIENGIATNDEAIGTIPETIAEMQTELESKANVDGVYETMTVGNAEQLVSTQFVEDNAPYIYRTSGGSADIGNREEDTIVGGTVAWNQIVQNGNFASGKAPWNSTGTYTIDNNVITFTTSSEPVTIILRQQFDLVRKHKYILKLSYKFESEVAINFFVSYNYASLAAQRMLSEDLSYYSPNVWHDRTVLYSPDPETMPVETGIRMGFTSTNPFPANNSISFRNIQFFDLTQMFGSAVADALYAMEQANAGSSVAWFKAQYPESYYEYNTGELKSVEGLVSHDMVGFNQLDASTVEEGKGFNSSGEIVTASSLALSDYIRVLPNTQYYFKREAISGVYGIAYYDINKVFISAALPTNANTVITTPNSCGYVRLNLGKTTYTEACFNLSWSGTRDSEYEPYVKRSYPLDSTLTLRGIPKVDVDGQMYYDGDVYSADGTVTRKYGEVNLGTLAWTYVTDTDYANGGYFQSGAISTQANASINIRCAKYTNAEVLSKSGVISKYGSSADKIVYTANGSTRVYVLDSAYTDATAFKTAMSGVMLVYELATPTTEQAEPYTTPQVVEDWGTEEYVTTGIVAVGHETKYPSNLRDKLQHLPELAEDDGAYLIQQAGTQMHLVIFRIPKAENLADGTYVLKATVSGGTPTYTWEAE